MAPAPTIRTRSRAGRTSRRSATALIHSLEEAKRADAMWREAAHQAQLPPAKTESGEDWRTWAFQGGRGAGKTRAGAEWLASLAARTRHGRFALVGATLNDVREVMIAGASGLMALPNRPRPIYEPSRRRLVFANGAVAFAFSAEEPDRLRGPQFHAAWADEFCAWAKPSETLANLRLALRLGRDPRLAITTTPRGAGPGGAALRALRAEASCVVTQAGTAANAARLAPGFVEGLLALYGGTRLARQELDGVLVEADGALFTAAMLARARGMRPATLERVVVAVDPPAGTEAGAEGSACGIVAAGRSGETFFVLADASCRGLSPLGWAGAAVKCARDWGAEAIHAEANQGGEMVRTLIEMAADEARVSVAVKLVRARAGKTERAQPVAALYEQGRVTHCGSFGALEEELMALGVEGGGSFDRADALVWAIEALRVTPPPPRVVPL